MEQDNQPYKLPPDDKSLTREDVMAMIADALSNQNGANKMGSGYFQSQNFVTGVSGWQLRDDGAEINGGVSVQSLNIPDTTTASSTHIDSTGITWWGANVATGYTGANAYILPSGGAVFKNIQVGGTTVQYVITNSGIFSYGDGSDGNATCDGSTAVASMSRSGSTYTLTRDVFFNNLTLNSGITIIRNNFRIFAQGTYTINGTDDNSGGNGSKGGTGTYGFNPGSGGSSGSTPGPGYFPAAPSAGAGGAGTGGGGGGNPGSNGSNITNSIGTVATGVGGNGAGSSAGGTVGSWTAPFMALKFGVQLQILCDFKLDGTSIKYGNSSGAGGGGGGNGGNEQSSGGGGGGGGGTGGISATYARNIVIGATGVIKANGGNGGAGGDISSTTSPASHGVGGGGGGGNGGVVILVYNSFTNGGSVTVSAGTGGVIGTNLGVSGTIVGATAGTNGSTGTIYQFQLSL